MASKQVERNPVSGTQAVAPHSRRAPVNGFRYDHHLSPMTAAIECAHTYLLDRQAADGHWVGELQGDTILESEYILLMAFLDREGQERVVKAARYLLSQQLPEGGWNNYPGGPADLSVS